MTIKLVLAYRTPNPRNRRQHWTKTMREKHAAQDALASALLSSGSGSSMPMQSTEVARICSMACNTLALYRATGRTKSVSKSSKRGFTTSTRRGLKSK